MGDIKIFRQNEVDKFFHKLKFKEVQKQRITSSGWTLFPITSSDHSIDAYSYGISYFNDNIWTYEPRLWYRPILWIINKIKELIKWLKN